MHGACMFWKKIQKEQLTENQEINFHFISCKEFSQRIYDLSYRGKVVPWSDGTREPVEGCFAP